MKPVSPDAIFNLFKLAMLLATAAFFAFALGSWTAGAALFFGVVTWVVIN